MTTFGQSWCQEKLSHLKDDLEVIIGCDSPGGDKERVANSMVINHQHGGRSSVSDHLLD